MNNQLSDVIPSTAPFAPILTPEKFADLIGVTKSVVDNWIKRGHIPSIKVGRRRFVNVVKFSNDLQGSEVIRSSNISIADQYNNPLKLHEALEDKSDNYQDDPEFKQSDRKKDKKISPKHDSLHEANEAFRKLSRRQRKASIKRFGSANKAIRAIATGEGL